MRKLFAFAMLLALCHTLFAQDEGGDKEELATKQMRELAGRCEEFKAKYGVYPKWLKDLAKKPDYVTDDKWSPILKDDSALKDPWGNKYKYSVLAEKDKKGKETEKPEIVSAGPDGVFDTEDDLSIPEGNDANIGRNETAAQKTMINMAQIESAWYRQDCDRNGQHDYWVYDYAGFYYAQNSAGTSATFTNIASANADPAVTTHWKTLAKAANNGKKLKAAIPRNGYYIRAIAKDPSGEPYANTAVGDTDLGSDTIKAKETKTCNPTEFGFCAYPAEYGVTGVQTFIVDQSAAVWQKDTGGKPVTQWPVKEGESPTTAGWAFATE